MKHLRASYENVKEQNSAYLNELNEVLKLFFFFLINSSRIKLFVFLLNQDEKLEQNNRFAT